MARLLSDVEISELLIEKKLLPLRWRSMLKPKRKSNEAFSQSEFRIGGESGHEFKLSIRTSRNYVLDFSVILVFVEHGIEYNLIRHNGRHKSEHTNIIERDAGLPGFRFSEVFHIHTATQRYQERSLKIDGYAEPTTLYSDLVGAINAMVGTYGFALMSDSTELPLSDEPKEETR